MEKKRVVFLFGAGSTLGWKSPNTSDLTNLVRESGFKTKNNKLTITEFIFQKLKYNGYSDDDINFETIINVIEELMVYHSQFNNSRNLPSLLSCFLSHESEDEIFNFSIKGEQRHGYQLQIPQGVDYDFSSQAFHNETPKQFFLGHLLSTILTDINAKISKYAYHSQGHSVIETASAISQSFANWMKSLIDNNILRLYTLNYERIFKILLERSGLNVFEGFDCGENIPYGGYIRANIPEILSNTQSNTFYNLHGSAYWKVLDSDKNKLPNPEIVLTSTPHLPLNDNPAFLQLEKGKTLFVTNIITGYQKAQKLNITPFKQMQSAFDNDCCFADKIFIIGYSFGDEHINQSLKAAIRYNSNVKIIIVDPNFIKNEMDYEFALRLFPYKQNGSINQKKVNDNLYSYYDDDFLVYTMTFEDFLNNS